jgi:hypothetical protein
LCEIVLSVPSALHPLLVQPIIETAITKKGESLRKECRRETNPHQVAALLMEAAGSQPRPGQGSLAPGRDMNAIFSDGQR